MLSHQIFIGCIQGEECISFACSVQLPYSKNITNSGCKQSVGLKYQFLVKETWKCLGKGIVCVCDIYIYILYLYNIHLCLSIYLSIYLSIIYLSIYLSIYQSIYLSIYSVWSNQSEQIPLCCSQEKISETSEEVTYCFNSVTS